MQLHPRQSRMRKAATLRSIAAPQLEAVGIKSGDKDYAKVQTALLQWQAAFIAKNGVAPDAQMEIDKQVGRISCRR